ncbi:MAG: tryptophanase [Thermoplasmata archaeon]
MPEPEPFRIKMIEHLKLLSKEERKKKISSLRYNVFKLNAEDVYIDMLTDSGTSAMSDLQWAKMLTTEQAYAGSTSFRLLEKTVSEIFGFPQFLPVHQGRAAENILFSMIVENGDYVPNNMHFDTTYANVKHKGGTPVNLVVEDAYDPGREKDFKGNMDISKLRTFIEEKGKEKIPVIMLTVTNNTAGGQPVSMENIKKVREVADEYHIPFFLDVCRFAENAYFIKTKEKEYADKTIREIVREMFSYADGFTFSAKKDGLANIGGILGVRDEELHNRCVELGIIIEGFPTYGGMACRDLAAIAQGIREAVEMEYLQYRHQQVKYLGDLLHQEGVPIVRPVGGHAVFIDAKEFLPHVPQLQYPAQALTAELYIEGGIRGVELGTSAFGETDDDGNVLPASLEFTRLAIPRRVYTLTHLDYVADKVISLYDKRQDIQGLERTYAPELLGHFMAEFKAL